ncbi:MAG: hypothetical protein FJ213_04865 [Ignavibacteria bacterium]|nr:hypothetical protein [Ignavibacteria bacterium]
MLRYCILLIVLQGASLKQELFSQQISSELDSIKNKFETFDYKNVISLSEKILNTSDSLLLNDRIEILRMKAISHYSLWDENSSKESFKEILKLNNQYNLDSLKNSPKIVSFYKSIKKEYSSEPPKQIKVEEKINIDSLLKIEKDKFQSSSTNLKTSFIKSLILPGWGHLNNGSNTKGWFLISSTAVTLTSSIYFSFDAHSKEKDYLAATTQPQIDELYNSYNTSYKLRNISLISLTLVWLYSQIDLAFLSNSGAEYFTSNRDYNLTPFTRNFDAIFRLRLPL